MAKVDTYTVQIRTRRPSALVPNQLAFIPIAARGSLSGRLPIPVGSGPFRPLNFSADSSLTLAVNPGYWGGRPTFGEVVISFMPDSERRVQALQTDRVDLIAAPPPQSIALLRRDRAFSLHQRISNRLIYLQLDQARDSSPFVSANDGTSIVNPLKHVRVREALSKAIDRDSMTSELLAGTAFRAEQLVPAGLMGYTARLTGPAFDADAARALLEQAGFGRGFRLTLHGPEDHYEMAGEVLRQIARMLERIDIRADVVMMPQSVYFKRASRGGNGGTPEFSVMLLGWTFHSADAGPGLEAFIHSFDKAKRMGLVNRGRYTNTRVDQLIETAAGTTDARRRKGLLERATEMAMGEHAIVPLYFEVNTWASKTGLDYIPRMDGLTYAHEARLGGR